jgi:DNA polymerase-4
VPGIGFATQRKLNELGVYQCGDICKLTLGLLHNVFGQVHGSFLWNMAHGRDDRPLTKRGAAKSISHQSTLQRTVTDKDYIEALLMYIAERCLWRLRAADQKTRSIMIYMRFADQRYAKRATHLKVCTQSEHVILPLISDMTREIWREYPRPRVTFVGVHLSDFQLDRQQEELFFDDAEKKERLSRVMGKLREKFHSPVITSARTFGLHHSYRLSQAGLSFSTRSVEEKEAQALHQREADEYMSIDDFI